MQQKTPPPILDDLAVFYPVKVNLDAYLSAVFC